MTQILALPIVSGQFTIVAGTDWRQDVSFAVESAPVDLTGIAFKLQMRSTPSDPTIWLDLSTAGAGITTSASAGLVHLLAPAAMTVFVPPGAYVADLLAEADGAIVDCCGGAPFAVTVAQAVTVP